MFGALNGLKSPFLKKLKCVRGARQYQGSQPFSKQLHSLKVIITPWYDANQYQQQLFNELTELGHQVIGTSCGTLALTKTVTNANANVLHLHWLHHFFLEEESRIRAALKMYLFIAQLLFLRLSGINIVWTVHNLKNHKNRHLIIKGI